MPSRKNRAGNGADPDDLEARSRRAEPRSEETSTRAQARQTFKPSSSESSQGESLKRKALGVGLFLVLLASLLNALLGERGLRGLMKARHDYDALLLEIQTLEAENEQLSDEIRALRSEPLAVERIAREVLGMAKPGELTVTIQQPAERSVLPD